MRILIDPQNRSTPANSVTTATKRKTKPSSNRNTNLVHVAVLLFFFLSGACGLIYEITWLRVLGLVFGNTTYATSTVLAGYMAGLGIGAFAFGSWIDRRGNPLKLYGLLEGGVGLYALATPAIWKLIEWLSIHFYRLSQASFFQLSLFKLVVSFSALLVPTFLMGGTLPVIVKLFANKNKNATKEIAFLYALNTAGAVLGVLLAGFLLLYTLGVWQTAVFTGIINLIICAVCLALARRNAKLAAGEYAQKPPDSGLEHAGPSRIEPRAFVLLVLFGLSGAVSMMYEIGWTRILAVVLGSSVYAFSVMLATFLLGIALGSYLFGLAAKRFTFGILTFSFFQTLTCFLVLIGINQFEEIPYRFVQFYMRFDGAPFWMELAKFLMASSVMLPPTILIGAMFACFIQIYEQKRTLGRRVGEAYLANTIGTILGSLLTGFVVIPLIGIQKTIILAALVNASIAIVVLSVERNKWKPLTFALVVGTIALPAIGFRTVKPWNETIITSGMAVQPSRAAGLSKNAFSRFLSERKTLYYKEGLSATVNVTQLRDNISLAVNGKVDASSDTDSFTQQLLGHLPMLLHSSAREVLVIGLGSGMTAGAVSTYPVQTIDCVELEKAVVKAADFFSNVNHDVLQDKRLRLFVDDGRNFLLTHQKQYDIIISEPSNPWMAGVANLFSYEHYRNMSRRLKPDGLVCQWLHAYSMSTEDLKMILRTFSLAFSDISLWTSYYPDLMLIGSNQKWTIDFAEVEKAFALSGAGNDLSPFGIRSAAGLFGSFWLRHDALKTLSKDARVNSDNWPYLEFSAPRNLYRNTTMENYRYLNPFRNTYLPFLKNVRPPLETNAAFYAEMGRGYVAKKLFEEAKDILQKGLTIDPNSPAVLEVLGILAYKMDEFDVAKGFLEKATIRNLSSPEAFYYLGLTDQKKAEPKTALNPLKRAVTLDPGNWFYLTALADVLAETGSTDEAFLTYEKALALSIKKGTRYETLRRMMELAFKTKNLERQTAVSKVLIADYPGSIETYERLSQALEAAGFYAESAQIYQTLSERIPHDSTVYINLARLYDKMGLLDDCRKAVEKAVRAEPTLGKASQIQQLLHRKTK